MEEIEGGLELLCGHGPQPQDTALLLQPPPLLIDEVPEVEDAFVAISPELVAEVDALADHEDLIVEFLAGYTDYPGGLPSRHILNLNEPALLLAEFYPVSAQLDPASHQSNRVFHHPLLVGSGDGGIGFG